jgi:hypothetical protein
MTNRTGYEPTFGQQRLSQESAMTHSIVIDGKTYSRKQALEILLHEYLSLACCTASAQKQMEKTLAKLGERDAVPYNCHYCTEHLVEYDDDFTLSNTDTVVRSQKLELEMAAYA